MKKVIIIFILLLSFVGSAFACSCIADDSIKNKFERSNEVFIGKVIKITEKESELEILININKSYKGNFKPEKIIYTNDNSAACGYNFESGETYLIYAYQYDNKLGTGLCSGTKKIYDANEDLKYLDNITFSGIDKRDDSLKNRTIFEKIIDFFRNLFSKKIEDEVKVFDFESCVDAGYPIMESYPAKCSDGKNTYTEEIEKVNDVINETKMGNNGTNIELEKPMACTREYKPVCGEIQIQCIKAPCEPIRETFSNSCEAKANNAIILYNGTCSE